MCGKKVKVIDMRGFVTLAIGDEYYYKLARNMLRSYKLWNKDEKYPFAILCDRENEYTKDFDDVIIICPEHGKYTSKFELFLHSPYEENIFIEPDCLIYRNLSSLWEHLSEKYDFTAFGWNEGESDVWFTRDVAKNYSIDTIPIFNPGYLFIRSGEKCKDIYKDCIAITEYLEKCKEQLPRCYVRDTLRDDPVLALAMLKNDCKCVAKPKVGKLLHLPSEKLICAHISKGVLKTERCGDGNLLHFSTKRTKQGLYLQQVMVMGLCEKNVAKWKIKLIETQEVMKVLELFCKVRNYMKR